MSPRIGEPSVVDLDPCDFRQTSQQVCMIIDELEEKQD